MALQINPSLGLQARRVQYPDGLPTGQAVITTAGRMVAAIKKSLSRCRGNTPIMMRRHYEERSREFSSAVSQNSCPRLRNKGWLVKRTVTNALSGGTCRLGSSEKQEGCGLLRMLCRVEGYVHEQERDSNQNQCDYDIHD